MNKYIRVTYFCYELYQCVSFAYISMISFPSVIVFLAQHHHFFGQVGRSLLTIHRDIWI